MDSLLVVQFADDISMLRVEKVTESPDGTRQDGVLRLLCDFRCRVGGAQEVVLPATPGPMVRYQRT